MKTQKTSALNHSESTKLKVRKQTVMSVSKVAKNRNISNDRHSSIMIILNQKIWFWPFSTVHTHPFLLWHLTLSYSCSHSHAGVRVSPLLPLPPVPEAQVWPRVDVPQGGSWPPGGSWPRATGARRQAPSDAANSLQMLCCIRPWQAVMLPPALPHSSITCHLLPTPPQGPQEGTEAPRRPPRQLM